MHARPDLPLDDDELIAYVIASEARKELKVTLHQFGLSRFTFFADLDGIAPDLTWQFSDVLVGQVPAAAQSAVPDPNQIRHALLAHFNLEEIRTLCADLSVDYDSLAGETKDGKAREMVAYLARRQKLHALVKAIRAERGSII